jgi:hypothetical protein
VKAIALTLRSRDDGAEMIAELVWENGRTQVVEAVPAIADDLHRLISVGLVEWVGPSGSRQRRHTSSTDVAFLERLADYFGRQSGFVVKLVERQVSDAAVKKLSPKQPIVRGATHNRTRQAEVIAKSMHSATNLPANRVLSIHSGPSNSERRAFYRRVFESTKANSHERN